MNRTKIAMLPLAVVGILLAVFLIPDLRRDRNAVADLEIEKIGGVWFIPAGKSQKEIVWLDTKMINPLYELLSSEVVESAPSKWQVVGRVGFTYTNGRVAGVDVYDTKSERGAFRCGNAYFRYNGNVPDIIMEAQ